jgi:NAD(P)-dependent dehydrogenase (short-subunit alcohol dehydrogenase family)
VLASTVAVHGPVRDGVVDEDTPTRRTGDPYGDTKLEGESRARTVAEALDLDLVVLRPTMIYGPRSGSWTVTPVAAIARGLPAVIGSGRDLLDAVYVDDVADAFVAAADTPAAAGETFLIGGEAVDWNRFFGAYAAMADRPLRRLPAAPLRAGARVAATVTRALTGRTRVNAEAIDVMTSRATYDHGKARRILGYAPEVGLEEGMRRTAAWLRSSGRLRVPAVALVTGAGGGLGQAVASELLAAGLRVYAADVRGDALEDVAAEGARPLVMDVTDPASVAEARARVEADGEIVDVVVNVAGMARPGALEQQPQALIDAQFGVNAFGPLHVARAFAPAMRRRGWGRIVNVGSTNGFLVSPFMGAYSAAKYALEALSDALRLELSPFGVEVIVAEPGAMRTPFATRAKEALRREVAEGDAAWAPYLQRFHDSDLWGEKTATEPASVARRVARLARHGGRARAYVTLDAVPTRALAMMPDAVKDRVFRSGAGLRPRKDDERG